MRCFKRFVSEFDGYDNLYRSRSSGVAFRILVSQLPYHIIIILYIYILFITITG